MHDLRRTAGSYMSQYGVPKDVRERILNHGGMRKGSITESVYNLQAQGADPGVRPADKRLASLERDEPPARRTSRRRSCARNRIGRQRCRSESVPIGARLLGLDRPSPEAKLERGPREARQHHQAGRSLFAQLVHGGRAGGHPLCQDPRHQTSPMACETARAPTNESRRDSTGQQDRAHGLGDDDQGRMLQGTSGARPLGEKR